MVDHWEGEDVIITFERNGSNAVRNYEGKITNISVSGGDENTEIKYAFGNKMIFFGKPKEKFKVDFDVIFHDSRFAQMQFGGSTLAAGTQIKSSNTQDYWRIGIFFVSKSEQTSSAGITIPPATSKASMQWLFVDCRAVTFERSFDSEDMMTGTMSFEFSPTDGDGYANFFEHYTNAATSTMLQLTTTNTEHRGKLNWSTTTGTWTGSYSR